MKENKKEEMCEIMYNVLLDELEEFLEAIKKPKPYRATKEIIKSQEDEVFIIERFIKIMKKEKEELISKCLIGLIR